MISYRVGHTNMRVGVWMTDESINMGGLLAKWRKAAGLSQANMADALETQQATISKLESGAYKLSVSQLISFLSACGLTLSDVAAEIETVARTEDRPLWERIDE